MVLNSMTCRSIQIGNTTETPKAENTSKSKGKLEKVLIGITSSIDV